MKKIYICLLPLLVLFASCSNNEDYKTTIHDPLLYSKTVKKLNDIVLENNFPPMIAARNYAYANIAAYEVIAASDSNYVSLAGQLKSLPPLPKAPAHQEIDYHLASMLAFCKVGNAVTFPEGSMDVYVKELKNKADNAGIPSSVLKNSEAFSNAIADAILNWSKKDNYAELRSAPKFTVTDTMGRWVPTPPMYAQGLEPHWMKVRPMLMDTCSQFRPIPPPMCNVDDTNCQYYKALMEVKQIVDTLNDEQKRIADFWDDNAFKMNVIGHVMYATKKFSPAGHWMNIVGIISKEKKADFSTTVYAYAKTSVALFEAFISTWDEKYRSNYVRPETMINKYFDADWQPYIQTPPFPEYTSGHAVISAAAAEVMTDIYGDNVAFTDSSEAEFGLTVRSFPSVREAAKEAAISRVYGGIHYKYSCDIGNLQGRKVGEFVVHRLKMKKQDEIVANSIQH